MRTMLRAENITYVLLAISLGYNVWLTREVEQMRTAFQARRSLVPGETVSPMNLETLDGRKVRFDYSPDNRPIVLYSFSSRCGWCMRNAENIRSLARAAASDYRLVSVTGSRELVKEYAAEFGHDLPIYVDTTGALKKQYKLGGTPQTVVISPSGEVRKVWHGAYNDETAVEIEDYFDVPLPGLTEIVDAPAWLTSGKKSTPAGG